MHLIDASESHISCHAIRKYAFPKHFYWKRQWHPTPVFLPRESQGWRSLVGCRLWGCTESDTTVEMESQGKAAFAVSLLKTFRTSE